MKYLWNDRQFRRRMLRFLREAERFDLFFVFGDSSSLCLADCQIDTEVAVHNFAERRQIIGTLINGLRQGEDIMRCFMPHHAIRARSGVQTLEILICFRCTALHAIFIGEDNCFVAPFGEGSLPIFNRFLPDYEMKLAEHEQQVLAAWQAFLSTKITDNHTEEEKLQIQRAAAMEFWAGRK